MADRTECMIRLDDITPDMDWSRFHRAKEILDQYGICPLIGVVPDNRDGNLHKEDLQEIFWDTIQSLIKQGWKVAQHGTYHVYETKDSGMLGINPFSEFAGLSYETQFEKLKAGKTILEQHGIATDIFMAPGHTYDQNTIKALGACGFRVVTDGLYKRPYYDEGILFVPCRLREFKKPSGVDTVCLHTNLMSEADMQRLDAFCKENRDVIVRFEPSVYEANTGKRNLYIKMQERLALWGRNCRNRIADSKRLAWYMEWTNHSNNKVKWLKRLVCLPALLFYFGKTSTPVK